LLAVQAGLIWFYLTERADHGGGTVHVERVSWLAPDLKYRLRDGSVRRLSELQGRPVLVHFWGTWCPPCRDELPTFLAWAEESEIATLALSLDDDWESVDRFLQGPAPAAVVLAVSAESAKAFQIRTLPETLLVDPGGRVTLRFTGPRDWSSGAVRKLVLREAHGPVSGLERLAP
jgi:thiol-disulfide isomerase/thioredoxin